jgi:hypothetical protein
MTQGRSGIAKPYAAPKVQVPDSTNRISAMPQLLKLG